MAERKRLKIKDGNGGSYFSKAPSSIDFIPSGCALLDCVLGGGYPLGRITNIVGDKSTGKTLLAIEACSNFLNVYEGHPVYYRETEAAFDEDYSAALGMPVDQIDFGKSLYTVEDLHDDLLEVLDDIPKDTPGLYILDSLDALSDKAELERDISDGSFGAQKAKKLSEMFRKLIQKINEKHVHVMIISQVRDNIGVAFGKKHIRSGGKALDFYASQCLWLAHIKQLKREFKKVKRTYGIRIKAKCEKNKISLPFRECFFDIVFGYGIDNLTANLMWLDEIKELGKVVDINKKEIKEFVREVEEGPIDDFVKLNTDIDKTVTELWQEIEEGFLPKRRKYQ